MTTRFARVLTTGALVGTAAVGAVAAAQGAGAPPLPKAAGGGTVTMVAAGLHTPTSFAFGGGQVFEGDGGAETSKVPNGGVFLLKDGKGVQLGTAPQFVGGLVYHGGTLYVSGGTITKTGPVWQIQAWSKWSGSDFSSKKVIYTAPKGFDGFNGLGYAKGKLYVGVDVGLTDHNDHGPATTSPYVYDILTMSPTGGNVSVFAKGIRQPWQMAFTPGSGSPYVSDLGQDKGAKNPPDFVLHVKKGDNYGFPTCNQTVASACAGFAKPYKSFSPHTDIMGMVIVGKTLYMTSFAGLNGKAGEVLSMPLAGGKVSQVVTGFVAPTVGLGVHNGSLYVGELTGQVFKVKP